MRDLLDTPASTFDEFWERYPRKVGKGQARKAYAKAVRIAGHDAIMFGLSQQIPTMNASEKQFIPHASTWLNGERWDDEPEQPNRMAGHQAPGGNTGEESALRAASFIRTPSIDSF
jgi:hypothetical protein